MPENLVSQVQGALARIPHPETEILTEQEAVLQVLDGAFDEISRICKERWNGTGDWRTSIPARPEWDSDLILGDALRLARRFIETALGCGGPDR